MSLKLYECPTKPFGGRSTLRCDLGVGPRGLVAIGIELNAEEAEPAADVGANGSGVLADPRREDQRVEAAQGCRHRRDRAGDAMRENREREAGQRIVRSLELFDAPRHS